MQQSLRRAWRTPKGAPMDLDLLKKIPLFAKLSDEDVRAVGALLHREEVPANRPIFYVGERGTSFVILASGQVAILRPDDEGKEMVVDTLGPGTFFGEISLLDGGPRTATVRTTSDSVLLRLGRDDFLRCLRDHPDLAIHVLEELGRRQRNMLKLLGNVRNANQEMDERRTFGQRVASACSAGMGSWTFIIVQSIVCVLWIVVNVSSVVGTERQWDPFPFNLLSLAVTTIAAEPEGPHQGGPGVSGQRQGPS